MTGHPERSGGIRGVPIATEKKTRVAKVTGRGVVALIWACPCHPGPRKIEDQRRSPATFATLEKNNDLHGDRCSVGGRSGRTWEQLSHPPLPPGCEASVSKALRARSSRAS